MSITELLFSFRGRVGRRIFWIWNCFYYLMIVTVATASNKLFPEFAYLILPVFLILLIVPDLAITAKRWHDRNKSIKWLVLNVPLILGRLTVPIGVEVYEPSTLETVVSLAALGCGAWILIECGFLKGDEGENQYGSPQN